MSNQFDDILRNLAQEEPSTAPGPSFPHGISSRTPTSVKLPPELLARVVDYAARHYLSRSAALISLIARGLDSMSDKS